MMNLFIIYASRKATLLSSPNSRPLKYSFVCMLIYEYDPNLNFQDFIRLILFSCLHHCLLSHIFNLLLLVQGVQPLLDGVISYLPCPIEVSNYALDQTKNEDKVLDFFKVDLSCFNTM